MQTNTLRKPHGKDINTARKGVSLEHRHFAFIAATIADTDDQAFRAAMALRFAKVLPSTNPKFDRDRFIAACKLDRA